MKPIINYISCFSLLMLMASACLTTTVAPTEAITPIFETLTPSFQPEASYTPSPIPTNTPIPTATLSPTATIDQAALNFGEPILQAIQAERPVFKDDFSSKQGWEATTAGIQEQLLPLSLDGGFIQTLDDGGRTYTHIANPYLREIHDFVVTVDAAFMDDIGENHRDRAIGLCWWPGDDWGESFVLYESGRFEGHTCTSKGPCPAFVTGKVEAIPVEKFVSLTLIHLKDESAVYVNGIPVAYHSLSIKYFHGSFSLCPQTNDGRQSDIKYDNLKMWNLNQILGLH